MITLASKVRKFAGTAAMATAAIAVGLSLGSGTAQAKPSHPHPHPHGSSPQQSFIQTTDTRIADPFQALFGVGEGTPFDDLIDSFHGLM
jgi:hypothetical protein